MEHYYHYLVFLSANKIIRSDKVEEVMLKVDRGKYVDRNAYMDAPQGIGYGVTISAPHMVCIINYSFHLIVVSVCNSMFFLNVFTKII